MKQNGGWTEGEKKNREKKLNEVTQYFFFPTEKWKIKWDKKIDKKFSRTYRKRKGQVGQGRKRRKDKRIQRRPFCGCGDDVDDVRDATSSSCPWRRRRQRPPWPHLRPSELWDRWRAKPILLEGMPALEKTGPCSGTDCYSPMMIQFHFQSSPPGCWPIRSKRKKQKFASKLETGTVFKFFLFSFARRQVTSVPKSPSIKRRNLNWQQIWNKTRWRGKKCRAMQTRDIFVANGNELESKTKWTTSSSFSVRFPSRREFPPPPSPQRAHLFLSNSLYVKRKTTH